VAWTIVAGAFLYKFIIYVSPHFGFDVEWLRISLSTLSGMKTNLSAIRLIHFLSVALLVTIYVGPTSRLLQWSVFSPAMQIGARPLEIYSLTLVLSKLGYLWDDLSPQPSKQDRNGRHILRVDDAGRWCFSTT
jgi:hypothetical protein